MLLLTKMPRRFTLAQLLMAVALASILLALYTSLSDLGGSGKPFHVVETVVFSPDGKYLAASMYNGCDSHVKMKSYVSDMCRTVAIISVQASEETVVDRAVHKGDLEPFFIGYRPTLLEFVGEGRAVAISAWHGSDTPSETFALSRDAKLLATLDGGNITLWDLDAMQKIDSFPDPNPQRSFRAPTLTLSPDGRFLALGRDDMHVWDLPCGQLIGKCEGGSSAAFSPQASLLAIFQDCAIQFWDFERRMVRHIPVARLRFL